MTKSTGRRQAGARYVASLACSGSGEGPPSGPAEQTSQIVFQSTRVTGTPDIFLMDPDGGNVRPVVTSDAVDQTPVLSPDGTIIAFVSDRDGEIQPAWSPDGAYIVFTGFRNGNQEIVRRNAGGGWSRLP
ncbi:MAG TPA: hypothetical protein VFG66_15620 [Gemmatimonadales bacterium]|nr:hypothetical protein [Gemmatimonadales bacterium]